MVLINSKSFLTELSKMLAFMQEEDRRTSLSMYEEMFSKAEDEEALLTCLKSPTRQAVLLARSYNAKSRKNELSGEVSSGRIPDFVSLISDISEEAFETAGYSGISPVSAIPAAPVFRAAEDPAVNDEPEEITKQEPDKQPFAGLDLDFEKEINSYIGTSAESITENSPEETAQQEDALPYVTTSIDPVSDRSAEEPGTILQAQEEIILHTSDDSVVSLSEETEDAIFSGPPHVQQLSGKTSVNASQSKGRTNVFLAVLYSLAAIPLTFLIVVLLIFLAFSNLGISVIVFTIGIEALISCFGGFAVFADIMAVMGAAFVLVALGVLFLWIFIWLVGKAIPGVIKGAILLGKRLCKEGGNV